jgi:hypothetical protein
MEMDDRVTEWHTRDVTSQPLVSGRLVAYTTRPWRVRATCGV